MTTETLFDVSQSTPEFAEPERGGIVVAPDLVRFRMLGSSPWAELSVVGELLIHTPKVWILTESYP